MSDAVALVALLRSAPKRTPRREIVDQVLNAGNARAVWESLEPDTLLADAERDQLLAEASDDVRRWLNEGWDLLTVTDRRYPARVREIHEAPPLLFAAGELVERDRGIAVVGSRKASKRGIAIAETVSESLVARGVTVVSGLARGIDTAAHATALRASGRTVAVIGTGVGVFYPAENRPLQERIAATGLVLSQFWPDAPPRAQHFPQRNAIMSGYSYATVVVEASENSGARIQARVAVAHGRPVILTDLVVDRTKWGQALEGRPGVYVARSHKELQAAIEDVLSRENEIEALLSRISGKLL